MWPSEFSVRLACEFRTELLPIVQTVSPIGPDASTGAGTASFDRDLREVAVQRSERRPAADPSQWERVRRGVNRGDSSTRAAAFGSCTLGQFVLARPLVGVTGVVLTGCDAGAIESVLAGAALDRTDNYDLLGHSSPRVEFERASPPDHAA